MEYLAQYYKNLSEQLQAQIDLLETQLNEIRAYTAAERQDPKVLEREAHQARRLMRIAQEHNRTLDKTPPSEERTLRSQRLSGMLGARGIETVRVASNASNIDSRIDTATPIKGVEELTTRTNVDTGEKSHLVPLPFFDPAEKQTEFDIEGVPGSDESVDSRGQPSSRVQNRQQRADYANELMAKRRAKIRQEMDKKSEAETLVRNARRGVISMQPPSTPHSSNATY